MKLDLIHRLLNHYEKKFLFPILTIAIITIKQIFIVIFDFYLNIDNYKFNEFLKMFLNDWNITDFSWIRKKITIKNVFDLITIFAIVRIRGENFSFRRIFLSKSTYVKSKLAYSFHVHICYPFLFSSLILVLILNTIVHKYFLTIIKPLQTISKAIFGKCRARLRERY